MATQRQRMSSRDLRPAIMLFAALIILLQTNQISAQLFPNLQNDEPADTTPKDDLQRLNSDRRTVQQFQQLQATIKSGDASDFREALDALRAADPGLMLPQSSGAFQPLHRGLSMLLLTANEELRNGLSADEESANRELTRVIADGKPQEILAVLHRHAGTDASLRAHMLMAMIHLDRGNSQAARYWLAPVLEAKHLPSLQETARNLSERVVTESADPAGKPAGSDAVSTNRVPPASSDESKTTTDQPPGAAASNDVAAADEGGEAKALTADYQFLHWMQSLPLSVRQKRVSQDFVLNASQAPMIPWSAWKPAIDSNCIFVRLPDMVTAFERTTGRHLWTRVLRQRKSAQGEPGGFDDMLPLMLPGLQTNQQSESADVTLLHRNEIIGRMTSDAERLYVISQVTEGNRSRELSIQNRILTGREEAGSAGLWELVAIEKATGRRIWTAGGAPVEKRFGNELSQTWFCGPPVVDGEFLYSVVERDSSIKLACLKAATGQVQWQMTLMYPDAAIAQDLGRQLLSAHSSVHQGVIFTTTTTGWFVAIDKLTQSVLWASRLPTASAVQSPVSRLRASSLNQVQMKPLETTWHSEAPFFGGKWVYCLTAECPSMCAFDLLTGKLEARKNIENSTLLVHADKEVVIVAAPKSLTAMKPGNLREIWKTPISSDPAVNVGSGIRNGDELAIPMTDGSIEFRSVKTGAVLGKRTGLRPARSSGALYRVGEDLVSFGPDHVCVISTRPPEKSPAQDALQRATFLMDTGRVDEASQLLNEVTSTSINRDDVRRLKFRIAAARAAADDSDEATIATVAELAGSADERAIAAFLRLFRMRKDQTKLAAYAKALCEQLVEPDGCQSVELPDADRVIEALRSVSVVNPLEISALAKGRETIRRPFRAWIASELISVLDNASEAERVGIIETVKALPKSHVLTIRSKWLSDVFLELAEKDVKDGQVSEETIQLMIAAFERRGTLDQPTRDALAQRLDVLATAMSAAFQPSHPSAGSDAAPSAESVAQEMSVAIVEVLRDDILRQLSPDASKEPIPPGSSILEMARSMEDKSYRMIPVSTSGQMSFRPTNRQALDCEPTNDPFLSAFNWSLRREPGAILAHSCQSPAAAPWVFPMVTTESTLLQSHESLIRCGSVIVFFGSTSVSGFSVVENRWLWTRPVSGTSTVLLSETVFRQFNPELHSSNLFDAGRRLCGRGDRWLCLQNASLLEVFDVYTGNSLWVMNSIGLPGFVYAGTEAVLISDRSGRDDLLLQTETGLTVSKEESAAKAEGASESKGGKNAKTEKTIPGMSRRASMARRVMRASGPDVILWNARGMFVAGASLEWVNMRTLDVTRTVALPDECHAQFLGYHELAVVSDDQVLTVIDLDHGGSREYAFSTEEDLPDLKGPDIRIMADRDFAYVFGSSARQGIGMPSRIYGLQMVPMTRQLRVIDRRKGTLAWSRAIKEGTFLCDDGGQSPVLLLLQTDGEDGAGNPIPLFARMGQAYRVVGVLKTTGEEVFSYPVVSQTPFPQLRLVIPAAEQIELDALGNRVRFVATPETPK